MRASHCLGEIESFFTGEAPAPLALSAAGPHSRFTVECSEAGYKVGPATSRCRPKRNEAALLRSVDVMAWGGFLCGTLLVVVGERPIYSA